MKEFFEGIQYFFEEIAFSPFDELTDLERSSWYMANLINWIFVIIAFCAMVYWIKQLKKFNDNNEERTDSTAHSYLG